MPLLHQTSWNAVITPNKLDAVITSNKLVAVITPNKLDAVITPNKLECRYYTKQVGMPLLHQTS